VSAKDKRARRALAALSQAERSALQQSIRSTFLKDGSERGYCHIERIVAGNSAGERRSYSRRDWQALQASEEASAALTLSDTREREREAERRHFERLQNEAASAALWERLGDTLTVAREHVISGARYRMYEALISAVALHAVSAPVRLERGRVNHWQWDIRRVPQPVADKRERRAREYPLGYASARGAWRYRAGAERSTVAGAVGAPRVTVAHSELVAYVPPEVAASAAASGENEAVAVKWAMRYTALNSPLLIWTYETIDYSIQAAGINTRSGYTRERSGAVKTPSEAASALVQSIRALAQAAKRVDRRAAVLQAAKRERERQERERSTARQAAELKRVPRLVR
jgi:hypothetical protein